MRREFSGMGSLVLERRAKRKGVMGQDENGMVIDTFNRERISLPMRGTGH